VSKEHPEEMMVRAMAAGKPEEMMVRAMEAAAASLAAMV